MTALVTVEQASDHLRLNLVSDDGSPPSYSQELDDRYNDLVLKMDAATAIVIDYIKMPDNEWTAQDAPSNLQAAILLVLSGLYDGRDTGTEVLSPSVKALLHRLRDPALA